MHNNYIITLKKKSIGSSRWNFLIFYHIFKNEEEFKCVKSMI